MTAPDVATIGDTDLSTCGHCRGAIRRHGRRGRWEHILHGHSHHHEPYDHTATPEVPHMPTQKVCITCGNPAKHPVAVDDDDPEMGYHNGENHSDMHIDGCPDCERITEWYCDDHLDEGLEGLG